MKEFELDRQVDVVGLTANSSSSGVKPNAVYVPVAVVPAAVVAVYALYVAVATIAAAELGAWAHQGIRTAYASYTSGC